MIVGIDNGCMKVAAEGRRFPVFCQGGDLLKIGKIKKAKEKKRDMNPTLEK